MGRKTEIEVVTVMIKLDKDRSLAARTFPNAYHFGDAYKDMNAKIQILMSSAGLKKRARVNFSGIASSRSLLIRRTMKSRSSLFKKRQD